MLFSMEQRSLDVVHQWNKGAFDVIARCAPTMEIDGQGLSRWMGQAAVGRCTGDKLRTSGVELVRAAAPGS